MNMKPLDLKTERSYTFDTTELEAIKANPLAFFGMQEPVIPTSQQAFFRLVNSQFHEYISAASRHFVDDFDGIQPIYQAMYEAALVVMG